MDSNGIWLRGRRAGHLDYLQATSDTYGRAGEPRPTPWVGRELTVTFDKAVTVDTTGGMPRIQFRLGPPRTDRWAEYSGGSGNTALTFTYEVQPGDIDSNGIWLPKNELQLQKRHDPRRGHQHRRRHPRLWPCRPAERAQGGRQLDQHARNYRGRRAVYTSTSQAVSVHLCVDSRPSQDRRSPSTSRVDCVDTMPRIQLALGPPRRSGEVDEYNSVQHGARPSPMRCNPVRTWTATHLSEERASVPTPPSAMARAGLREGSRWTGA